MSEQKPHAESTHQRQRKLYLLSSSLALRHLSCLGKTGQAAASTRRRNNSKLARP